MSNGLLTSTGNLLTGIVSASLFQAADGSKKYFFQIQDVTDYRLTLERLREQQAMLNAISENSTDAIFLKDTQGRFVFEKFSGRPADGETSGTRCRSYKR